MHSPDPPGRPFASPGPRPGRTLPALYAFFAHGALLVALGRALVAPSDLTSFPSSPRFVGYVHLLTLGFLASAVYGAIYAFAPAVLRLPVAERRTDLGAFALHVGGTMALAHGLAAASPWTAALGGTAALAAGIWVVGRLAAGLPASRVPLGTKMLIGNAATLFLLGSGLGLSFAWARIFGLPAALDRSSIIAAHAHLAAYGWLTGTLFGFGSRMLPMLFSARPGAGGDLPWVAVLHGTSALGLATALLFLPALVPLGALVAVAAIAGFFAHVAALARRRVRPARFRRGFDPTPVHAGLALAALAAATVLGVAIAWHPEDPAWRRAIVPYGILALLGFLAQMVFGVSGLLAPAYAWIRRHGAMPQAPHRPSAPPAMAPPTLDFRASLPYLRAILAGWGLGVPLLALGAYAGRGALIQAGSLLLMAATLTSAGHLWTLARTHTARLPGPTR